MAPRDIAVVRALATAGTNVFAGEFDTLGGQARRAIGAVDKDAGIATPWNPDADGSVSALAGSGTTLYAAGGFRRVAFRSKPFGFSDAKENLPLDIAANVDGARLRPQG